MNDEFDGFILKQTDYKESAVILSVLTKEAGKISLIAAGARKMTSKNAGSILPYTRARFQLDYRDDKTVFRMKTARTVSFYRYMHENLEASLASAVLAEAADVLCYEDADPEVSRSAFDLLESGFDLLNQGKKTDLIMAIYLARLMDCSGIGPNVEECAICGSTKVSAVSIKDGGFLCSDCARRAGVPLMSVPELKQFRLINKADLSQYDIVERSVSGTTKDLSLLLGILKEHEGIEIRSFGLYNRLFAIE